MSSHRLRPLDLIDGRIELPHGSGGRATAQLVSELFARHFQSDALAAAHDAATLPVPGGHIAVSTDSYVVSPLFFPGGCIGDLAVNGSVNDVAMAGADPIALTIGFILEEGFPLRDLDRICKSIASVSAQVGIPIVSGDTKVVERGKADGVFISTTCLGIIPPAVHIAPTRATPTDAILVSGPIGNHGIAILSQREGIAFDCDVTSDTAPLHSLVSAMRGVETDLHVLRDPTRGGVAAALHEIAETARVNMDLQASAIPIERPVRAACELLGLDPLHLACEGRLLAICPAHAADRLLAVMRSHPQGRLAARIGSVTEQTDLPPIISLRTELGGRRIVAWPAGEQLPRIC